MKYIDSSCPYCGAPVILDKNNRGLCEYCGQWLIYDTGSDKVILEDAYQAGYEFEKGRQQAQAEVQNTYIQPAAANVSVPASTGKTSLVLVGDGMDLHLPDPAYHTDGKEQDHEAMGEGADQRGGLGVILCHCGAGETVGVMTVC